MEQDQRNVFSSFPQGLNQDMNMIKPTYDQFIIKPPARNKTHGQRATRLIVDSRERNMDLYPDASNYVLELENEYKDVISVELSQANIPNSFYNIYHYVEGGKLYANNIIHIHLITNNGDESSFLELPPGKYTAETDFSNALNTLLSSYTSTYIGFTSIFDTLTQKIQITIIPKADFDKIEEFYFEFLDPNTCTILNPFNNNDQKKYPQHSLGPFMGFNKKNVGQYTGTITGQIGNVNIVGVGTKFTHDFKDCYSYPKIIVQDDNSTYTTPLEIDKIISDTHLTLKTTTVPSVNFTNSKYYPETIISPNVIELECDKYIIMDIRELHRLKSNTDTIDDRFAVIPIDYTKCATKVNFSHLPTQREIKYFNPPFARLSKMNIAFYRYNGDPLHFNGVNHLLDFNINTLNQAGKYNDTNSGTLNN